MRTNITVDTDTIRRLHSIAKELDSLANSLGRHERRSEEEMYMRALEVVRATNHASTSHLQHKMGIGCNHAARLIDLLEERGVIGPQVGA